MNTTRAIIAVVSLDPTWLFLSLIPGGVGFVMVVSGKKQQRWPIVAFGIAFMVTRAKTGAGSCSAPVAWRGHDATR